MLKTHPKSPSKTLSGLELSKLGSVIFNQSVRVQNIRSKSDGPSQCPDLRIF